MSKNDRIVPAILEQDRSAVESKLKRVSDLVSVVQIDICDGQFVPTKTYASSGRLSSARSLHELAKRYKVDLVVDLMVDLDHGNCMDRWIQSLLVMKPRRVIFHLGSTYRWGELFTKLETMYRGQGLPFECGLAVRVNHTRREIAHVFEQHPFGYVQIMGIERVGHSGQKFSPHTIDRVKKLRRKYSDTAIAIDGGVKLENAEALFKAGATRLGVNSGLFESHNIQKRLEDFQKLHK